MGNDHSNLSGIQIEEKSVEVSDFWTHHFASIINSETTTNLSVLVGELFVAGPLWKTLTPLEINSKHLMIYRHPCILKYISSWRKNSKYYLAVEDVVPLAHVLGTQNTLQICIGLHSILKALCFLHETALISHNNVCTASIYVSKDGSWKLGGMEYACRFSDLTPEYLKKSQNSRYNKAIDPNEIKHAENTTRRDFVDIFAYSVLVREVLRSKSDVLAEDVSNLTDFTDFCKSELENIEVALRPKLSALLKHDFFNHEFITIHSFLVELPLKTDEDKSQFFSGLLERLRVFPEVTVATQFSNLLLSRLVLLNKTAGEHLVPYFLCPKNDDASGLNLFSKETMRSFLAPRLLEIFSVRDAQIRLLLLTHFTHFIPIFSDEELRSCILPELLLGIKDTNDVLVSMTLRTLADLVPLLGAATVIGGKRGKLFTDGRPVNHSGRRSRRGSKRPDAQNVQLNTNPIVQAEQNVLELPERPRPDGEEGETSAEELDQEIEEELENWEDWGEANPIPQVVELGFEDSVLIHETNEEDSGVKNVARKKSLPDISELDIKNQAVEDNEDIDFFQDMEPVIETAAKFVVEEKIGGSKLSLGVTDEANEDGWVDDEW